jgi:hypothetical protein
MNNSLKDALYDACLKSAIAMGPRIKDLSWFGKNHLEKKSQDQDKKAA